MTFLNRMWPWSRFQSLRQTNGLLNDTLQSCHVENKAVRAELRSVLDERDQWIKTAKRLRVERDQAKDALAKVQG